MTGSREGTVGRNLSAAFLANIAQLAGSILLTLLLPKFLGVAEYSYYQLYIFYTSYAGFFALGWTDGLNLRHGGEYYGQIDRQSMHGQLRVFSLMELVLSLGVCMLAIWTSDSGRAAVWVTVGLCLMIYLPRAFLHNLLQATNRINSHALGLMIDRGVHIALTMLGLALGRADAVWFIASELIGRFCGGVYIFLVCRDVLKAKPCGFGKVKEEAAKNISCGFVLMISNIAGMLIIGVVRQGIELCWDVETFGKLSLTLAVSNMLMTFINSVAMVLFPILRRSPEKALAGAYRGMRMTLMLPMLGVLVLYYPVRALLTAWLPQYADSLRYTAILFVMCVYESKMSMLVNTYMKTLRREKMLLRCNLVALAASLLLTVLTCGVLRNLDLAVLSIVALVALRSSVAESMLSDTLGMDFRRDLLIEHAMAGVFIAANWLIGGIAGMAVYAAAYGLFLALYRRETAEVLSGIRQKYFGISMAGKKENRAVDAGRERCDCWRRRRE